MKRERRDLIKVGLFVVVAGAILVGALLWIAGSSFLRPMDDYTVLFDKSVSGLLPGANVEYQGVVVGRVRDLKLTREIPPKVAVDIEIEPGTPVRSDTVAALLGSLVTGIKFIQLQGGTATAEPLPPGGVIRGDVTSIEEFRDQLAEVADRALNILRRLDEEVFTPTNTQKITEFVANLGNVTRALSKTIESLRVEETTDNIARLIDKAADAADNLNLVIRDFYERRDDLYGGIDGAVKRLDQVLADLRALVVSTNQQIGGTGSSVGTFVQELTAATNRLQETLDVIRSDPSVLLRGREVPEREFDR